MLTAESLAQIMPGVPREHAAIYAECLNAAMLEGKIITPMRAAYFLAQIAHESGDLRWMEEIASGEEYEGRRDLGNIHPGDGKRYKGRGPIQLTGRLNYAAAGQAIKVNFLKHPKLAADPRYAFRTAVWFWSTHFLNTVSDTGNFKRVTQIINGGLNGYEDRVLRLRRVLSVPSREYLPGTRAQRVLRRLGKR